MFFASLWQKYFRIGKEIRPLLIRESSGVKNLNRSGGSPLKIRHSDCYITGQWGEFLSIYPCCLMFWGVGYANISYCDDSIWWRWLFVFREKFLMYTIARTFQRRQRTPDLLRKKEGEKKYIYMPVNSKIYNFWPLGILGTHYATKQIQDVIT